MLGAAARNDFIFRQLAHKRHLAPLFGRCLRFADDVFFDRLLGLFRLHRLEALARTSLGSRLLCGRIFFERLRGCGHIKVEHGRGRFGRTRCTLEMNARPRKSVNAGVTVRLCRFFNGRAKVDGIGLDLGLKGGGSSLGGSAFAQSLGRVGDDVPTVKNPDYFCDAFDAVQELIRRGWVMAGHDISAGGLITTLLEMCFANTTGGLHVNLHDLCQDGDIAKTLFAENPGVVIEVHDDHKFDFKEFMEDVGVGYAKIGYSMPKERKLTVVCGDFSHDFDIDALRDVWYKTSYLLDRDQSKNGCAAKRYANYKHQPLRLRFNHSFTGRLSTYGISPERRTPSGVKAAIIREKGTNGEREMAYSLYLAGFDVKDVMMTDLITGRETLDDINMIVFCGGFSNSDVLGSAKGWAGAFLFNPKAKEALDRFYARPDTLSLGVCNGCQLMMELGLVTPSDERKGRMLHNDSRKFESAFVGVDVPQNDSVMLGSLSGSKLGIWVAHGEGKFSLPYPEDHYNVVLKYAYAEYPGNPNGSDYAVAGIASADGRHLAMMPHLERAIFPWQNAWYPQGRRERDEVTPWIEAFVNARKWVESHRI